MVIVRTEAEIRDMIAKSVAEADDPDLESFEQSASLGWADALSWVLGETLS